MMMTMIMVMILNIIVVFSIIHADNYHYLNEKWRETSEITKYVPYLGQISIDVWKDKSFKKIRWSMRDSFPITWGIIYLESKLANGKQTKSHVSFCAFGFSAWNPRTSIISCSYFYIETAFLTCCRYHILSLRFWCIGSILWLFEMWTEQSMLFHSYFNSSYWRFDQGAEIRKIPAFHTTGELQSVYLSINSKKDQAIAHSV